jgi:hypothetical protein
MGYKDRPPGQGGQGKGNQKPGQGGSQQGGREGQGVNQKPGRGGSDKPTTRPTPSGVPNEGRSTAGSEGRYDQGIRTGKGDNEVKDGRQGPGEIPNPEDQNDRGSRSGFDGNAAEKIATDDDEGDEGFGADQNRTKDPNNQTRQTNQSSNQRRVLPLGDETL